MRASSWNLISIYYKRVAINFFFFGKRRKLVKAVSESYFSPELENAESIGKESRLWRKGSVILGSQSLISSPRLLSHPI